MTEVEVTNKVNKGDDGKVQEKYYRRGNLKVNWYNTCRKGN